MRTHNVRQRICHLSKIQNAVDDCADNAGLGNVRSAGHMRSAKHLCVARELQMKLFTGNQNHVKNRKNISFVIKMPFKS